MYKIRHTALLLVLPAALALGAPHVPKDDATVLERLPYKRSDPGNTELRRLRARVSASPQDALLAADLAQRYFEMAAAEGDPRYVGYAEAALARWKAADAPPEILFSRALVRQYRHDFAGALADLDRLLRSDPTHVGAHAWSAAIFMVEAEYSRAREQCRALEPEASELLATGCSAYVDATTGRTRDAYARLLQVFSKYPKASAQLRLWTLTRLAEMASRLDDPAAAEEHFRQALRLGLDDNFLLAAYADFLLERGRPEEVVALLRNWARADTLLLRLAIAEKVLGLKEEAQAHIQALGERFAASALRGERLHLAEEARYLLELKQDPRGALALAAENWKLQREPRDAAILLESALAAREPQAAAPVQRWLDESRFESVRLRALAAKLK